MIGLIDVAPAFSFIANRGLLPGTATYDQQAFGNANLVMDGTPFSLRFQRDRGQVFMDIGNDAAGWYKLEYVLEFVANSITQKQLGEPPDTTLLANLLQGHWDKVTHLFNDQQEMSQLQIFAKQKTASLSGEIFGNL